MTYYESAEGITISHQRMIKELLDHGLVDDVGLLYEELGERSEYDAQDVLQWLGY